MLHQLHSFRLDLRKISQDSQSRQQKAVQSNIEWSRKAHSERVGIGFESHVAEWGGLAGGSEPQKMIHMIISVIISIEFLVIYRSTWYSKIVRIDVDFLQGTLSIRLLKMFRGNQEWLSELITSCDHEQIRKKAEFFGIKLIMNWRMIHTVALMTQYSSLGNKQRYYDFLYIWRILVMKTALFLESWAFKDSVRFYGYLIAPVQDAYVAQSKDFVPASSF